MPYNLTNVADNASNVLGLVQGVNDVLMFGWLGTFTLIAISFVLFSSFYVVTADTKKSVVATSFLAMGFSLFFMAMNLVPTVVFFITLMITAIAIALSWK